VSVAAAPVVPGSSAAAGSELVIGAAVAVAVAATFVLAPISGMSLSAVQLESLARVVAVGIPVAAGLYARRRVPFGRLGTLLVASALVWLAVTLSLAGDEALAFSVGRVADWVSWGVLLYLVLAFPEGRLVGRLDRALAASVGVLVALLYLPTALLVAHYPTPSEWVTCAASCPRNAFMVVSREPAVIGRVVVPLRELVTVLLFLAVVGRLVHRIVTASKVRRLTLTPVLAVAVAGIALTALGLVIRRVAPGSAALDVLRWAVAFALPAVALAFLAGLLRWRLYVGASLTRFAAWLRAPLGPEEIRAAFADAFEDPPLAIVYAVADGHWAAADGRPAPAPVAGAGRSVTAVHDGPRLVAALIHDQALESERAFVDAAASYATVTLENQRLAAEVGHLVRDMREIQSRATTSEDRARQQIERDLHDGAQQRLIALRIKLQLAAERSGTDPSVTPELFDKLGAEVDLAIEELRSLARGVFTPILTSFGPVEALRGTVRDAPIPTTVTGRNLGRHSPEAERAVYFCCLEALQNVYKQARAATAAHITIAENAHELTFEVTDDGVGFDVDACVTGAGLRNMRDRVGPLGGALTIKSAPRQGTRITGTLPLTAP
jgi:signal transduction histidine kinase